jgi:hypothetical protein
MFEGRTQTIADKATAIGSGRSLSSSTAPSTPVSEGWGSAAGSYSISVAGGVANDLFREAARQGLSLSRVVLRVEGGFAGEPAVRPASSRRQARRPRPLRRRDLLRSQTRHGKARRSAFGDPGEHPRDCERRAWRGSRAVLAATFGVSVVVWSRLEELQVVGSADRAAPAFVGMRAVYLLGNVAGNGPIVRGECDS